MQKQSISWSVKQLKRMYENGKVSFDHPIQRKSGQWKALQKSELVHTVADDYPLPPVYSVKEGDLYFILDGKQRLTTLFDYLNGDFATNKEMETVTIEEETFEISDKTFDELPEVVQDHISSYMILVYKMDVDNDEEIENLFLKLNQGTPLSKQQKAKAVLGVKWANTLNELYEHPFATNKAHFTENQLNSAGNETTIIQTMMLLDPTHEFKNTSTNAVYNYTQTFKDDVENKQNLVKSLKVAMDYLDEVFTEKDKTLLKKVHLPMVLLTADHAIKENIPVSIFEEWVHEFKQALKEKSDFKTDYNDFTGQGSTKKYMVEGRRNAMINHLDTFSKAISPK